MRNFLKHAQHDQTRLLVPVVEYGLSEFTVSVRQIVVQTAFKSSGHFSTESKNARRRLGLAGTTTGFVPEGWPSPHAPAGAWGAPRQTHLRLSGAILKHTKQMKEKEQL